MREAISRYFLTFSPELDLYQQLTLLQTDLPIIRWRMTNSVLHEGCDSYILVSRGWMSTNVRAIVWKWRSYLITSYMHAAISRMKGTKDKVDWFSEHDAESGSDWLKTKIKVTERGSPERQWSQVSLYYLDNCRRYTAFCRLRKRGRDQCFARN